MLVGLGVLGQLFQVLGIVRGHLETADRFVDVGLDLGDAFNLLQVASNRGGTTPSDHVGDFETDEGQRRSAVNLLRIDLAGRFAGIRRRSLAGAAEANGRRGNQTIGK